MTTLTTNGIKLLIVEVPEDAYEFEVSQHPLTDTELIYQMPVDEKEQGKDIDGSVIYLEKYNHHASYKILGTITSGKVDFDCEELVFYNPKANYDDYSGTFEGAYTDYVHGIDAIGDAKTSFLSLLQSKGIEYKKCVVLRIN